MAGKSINFTDLSPSAVEAVHALRELAAKKTARESEAAPSESDISDYDDDAAAKRFQALAHLLECKLSRNGINPETLVNVPADGVGVAAHFVAWFKPLCCSNPYACAGLVSDFSVDKVVRVACKPGVATPDLQISEEKSS